MTPPVCSATTSGVPPEPLISSIVARTSSGIATAPRGDRAAGALAHGPRPSARSTPDMRVCAVNSTNVAPSVADVGGRALGQGELDDRASFRRLVGEAREPGRVAHLVLRSRPSAGTKRDARRLPYVIVPVLSSSRVLTSPAASTARPDIARTLTRTSRSMPAMPIALSSAPIVVGMRQTSSAISTSVSCGAPA